MSDLESSSDEDVMTFLICERLINLEKKKSDYDSEKILF